jgi:hypothetical protein
MAQSPNDPDSDADVVIAEKGELHDSLMPMLGAMFREFQDASKKKADAVLNKKKVVIVNRLLVDIFKIVDAEPTRHYLDLLDEDELPQNGEVVLILGQAVAAMEAFKEKYFRYDSYNHENRWMTVGGDD